MYLYFDNAATTRPDGEVCEAMMKCLEDYGNPSAQYSIGFTAKRYINESLKAVARLINSEDDEIVFTSGGTEADNNALMYMYGFPKGKSLVTSGIEHPAVLNMCKRLETDGYTVRYIHPDRRGFINPEDVEKAIDGTTVMVSCMMANNELGTIEPVDEICRIAHKKGCIFHTDAVQCLGIEKIDVKKSGFDLLSASSHKLYGPKGAGLLFIKRGISLPALIVGGGQQNGRRSGTENLPGIVGFAKACQLADLEMEERKQKEKEISSFICSRVLKEIEGSHLNGVNVSDGDYAGRLPGNLHFSFEGVNGTSLRILLDMKGICVSTGSACEASNEKHSHVLDEIGLPEEYIDGSLRITCGKNNTMEEAETLVSVLKDSVNNIRKLREY